MSSPARSAAARAVTPALRHGAAGDSSGHRGAAGPSARVAAKLAIAGHEAAVPAPLSPLRPATDVPHAAPVSARPSAAPRRAVTGSLLGGLAVSLLAVTILAIFLTGLPYYRLDMAERVRSPLHALFRPSGLVGQGAGVAALLCFTYLWLYPLRKRFRALAFTGSISGWLSVHIVAGLAIPLLAGLHAGWRFGGLAGLSYGAMLLVVLSGIVGKYIYSRIPRSRGGLELTLDEVRARSEEAMGAIQAATGIGRAELEKILGVEPPAAAGAGPWTTLPRMIGNDLRRHRTLARLRREWTSSGRLDPAALREALGLARRRIMLTQQLGLMEATQKIFRFWHVAHRPVAVTALLAVVVHVVVVVLMGATWFH